MLKALPAQVCALAVLLLSSLSTQAMYIDRAIIDFLPGEATRQDVKVINDSDDNLYVKIDVMEVINPGTEQEERKPVTNPDDIKLLVTPAKMVIPPKSSKLVRLLNLDDELKEEKVYRINVTPIMPPLQEESKESKVRVVIAYQVLVLVAPNKPHYLLETERKTDSLTVKNTGNSYVIITGGKQCPATETADIKCLDVATKRLYPGNTYQIEQSYKQPTELSLQGVVGNETVSIP